MRAAETARRWQPPPGLRWRGRILRVLAVVGVVFAVMYATTWRYLEKNQKALIYFPAGTHLPAAETNFALRNGKVTLRGWLLHPEQSRALIYFGGNAEGLGMERDQIGDLFPGRAVYLVDYRGYGASDGSPDERALFSDALALYDVAHARHASVAVVGRSLGSGVASYLASRRPLERLALVTPFDSLVAVAQSHYPLFPIGRIATERYESSRYIATYAGPVLVLRAGRDEVVPQESTDRLIAAMRARPTVKTFPLAGHNTISDDEQYGRDLADFMK